MTRAEALKILDTIPTIGEQVDAMEMAIKALEDYESVTEFADRCRVCGTQYTKRAKGTWIHRNDDHNDWLECSECGYGSEGEVKYGQDTPYCPMCGADMREVEE